MSDDLDEMDELEDVNDDEEEIAETSEKARAQASLEARRRLERKLEETRLRKQIADYDFDID